MKTLPTQILLIVAMLLAVPSAWADGLVANGHVNGPHTDLTLTADQMKALLQGHKKIALTDDQRKRLQGLPKSASVKEILVVPADTNQCTDFFANVAIQVNPWTVEVANELFGRDLEAEGRANEKWFREEEDKKFAKEQTHRGSRELVLCDQAGRCAFNNPAAAIPLYEEALRINPHLTDAKAQLCCAWNNLGVQKERQGKLQEALHCFQKSQKYTDSRDGLLFSGGQRNIARVKAKLAETRSN